MGEVKQLVPSERRPRDHHHRIAMLVAQKVRTRDIAAQTGLSMQRICYLKNDKEFQELVKVYDAQVTQIETDFFKQAVAVRAGVHLLSLEELRDRLEEHPESFSARDLLEIYRDTGDRMGMGPVQRNESVSVNVDLADSLAEARRRELQLSASVSPDAEGGGSLPAEGPAPA